MSILSVRYAYKTLKAYEAMCKHICQRINLPQTAFDILMFLGNNPEYKTAADIVEIRGIKANLVSINVDKLVQEGFLERLPVPGDRRKYMLKCSDKAHAIIKEGQAVQASFFEKLFDGVDETSRDVFRSTLKTIETNLDKMIEV